jgi:L-cysteine desulfidase
MNTSITKNMDNILKLLRNDVKPAVGCTEPVAIALAAAAAKSVLTGDIDDVSVKLSPNIYKNGMNVGIPGIDRTGLDVAAALGAVIGTHKNGLQILGEVSNEERNAAIELLNSNKAKVTLLDTNENIYLEAVVKSGNDTSKAIIIKKHDNIVSITLNDKEIFSKNEDSNTGINSTSMPDEDFFKTPIRDIVKSIEQLEHKEIAFMIDGLEMNLRAAKVGLSEKLGIGVGSAIKKAIDDGLLTEDFPNTAMMLTAAASDARMSGMAIPVMSSNGSGNHGLTAILPIAAYREYHEVDDEKIAKALAISHVITGYIKHYVGRLTPLCGCSIAASTGATCGIVWLMGGTIEQLENAIKNMIANQAGVICDGAKPGCALKLGTAAASSVQSAIYALYNHYAHDNNGIVTGTAEESIKNLGILSKKGMSNVDKTIIEIMESHRC